MEAKEQQITFAIFKMRRFESTKTVEKSKCVYTY